MEKKRIEEKIREILQQEFKKEGIDNNSEFMDGIDGWDLDSLEFVRLIVSVEKCFSVIIDFDEEFHTMNELVEIIQRKEDK